MRGIQGNISPWVYETWSRDAVKEGINGNRLRDTSNVKAERYLLLQRGYLTEFGFTSRTVCGHLLGTPNIRIHGCLSDGG